MNQNHIYRKSAFSVGNINCLFLCMMFQKNSFWNVMQLSSLEITEDNQHTSTGRNKESKRGGGKAGRSRETFQGKALFELVLGGPS